MRIPRTVAILVGSLLLANAQAQSGRSMVLLAPVVLGQTATMALAHPPALAGRQFAMAMCSPTYPGELLLTSAGVWQGTLRLDPLAYGLLGIGVLDASGLSPRLVFDVPNDPLLVGASFDVQGADVSATWLTTLTDNDLEIVVAAAPADPDMVAIAPGPFAMGSVAVPGRPWEGPVHPVTVSRPFWIGRHEVTQAEYQAVMGSNPSTILAADRPVDGASYAEAMAYCAALSSLEAAAGRLPSGYLYRLPTEAEWEYCCRAGTSSEWSTGASLGCGQASIQACVAAPTAVGTWPANAFGLHDMHGNVREWCLDGWDGVIGWPTANVVDPYRMAGPARVARGGSVLDAAVDCRSASRVAVPAGAASPFQGFRVVLAPALVRTDQPSASSTMVAISPGSFSMGSAAVGGWSVPEHQVTISQPFWIGRFEVTQAEYATVMGNNPSGFQGVAYPDSGGRPVETVSWNDAVAYCEAVSAQEAAAGRLPFGYEYRLPTEAEWEYCCRAGTTSEWHFGASVDCTQANLAAPNPCFGQTRAVGSHPANGFGLHDMHGNVWEWCLDGWSLWAGYAPGAVVDPYATTGSLRICRGGSWADHVDHGRSAHRGGAFPTYVEHGIGLRIVCAPILP